MTEIVSRINDAVGAVVWGPPMLLALFGIGVFFTFGTGFFQIARLPYILRNTIGTLFQKSKGKDRGRGISPFQAVSTALASTLGIGNIVGVATAIVSGGEGAVFWMWVSAFFGMMTKYAEIVLSVCFRRTGKDGLHYGGPMYYLEYGMRQKWLACAFALLCTAASFGVGNIAQSNSMASALNNTFEIPTAVTGVASAAVTSLVMLGGIKRISKVTEALVPFMGIFYIAGSLLVLMINSENILPALRSIFCGAFSFRAVGGGVFGTMIARAIRFGFARGIFSNEAGLGSAPIAHAAADSESPLKQGLWGIFEVFFDTLLLCTITALVIITSGLTTVPGQPNGAALTTAAFSKALGLPGEIFVTLAIALFAQTTLFGWSYYGVECLKYLVGDRKAVRFFYKLLYILVIIIGSGCSVSLVWEISDTLNGLMAIPNLIALAGLGRIVLRQTKKELTCVRHEKPACRAEAYGPRKLR